MYNVYYKHLTMIIIIINNELAIKVDMAWGLSSARRLHTQIRKEERNIKPHKDVQWIHEKGMTLSMPCKCACV